MSRILTEGSEFYNKSIELVEFYRNNPIIAAEDLLFVDIPPAQKIILQEMWFKPFVLVTAARGLGKSFLLSVISPLYAMLYPGRRVLIMAPSYRQSKIVFDEIKKRWTESPIFRESTTKKPTIGMDKCYVDFRSSGNRVGSSIQAYPLGAGDKIRGLRGHLIVVDEMAKVPEEIYDLVIRPMGAAKSSPMENVRRIESLRRQMELGLITSDEFEDERHGMSANKLIGVSSAEYQFNHMYKRMQVYEEQIRVGKGDKYGVLYFSYKDAPEGFLDEDNIEEAKSTMSSIEFRMEYKGEWVSDSDGAFKASLIEKCRSRDVDVKVRGVTGRKYIMGVDPARSSDSFAIVIAEIGVPSHIVYAFEKVGMKFPEMANKISSLCDDFDISLIVMDAGAGGGGVAIKDILSNEHFFKSRLILDMDDDDHRNLEGRRILKMNDPKPKNIADTNFSCMNLLEHGLLKFARRPIDDDSEKEEIYSKIDKMLKQTVLVTMTKNKSGTVHFDIPATGKGDRKKDLYSAFILAGKGLHTAVHSMDLSSSYVNVGGIVKPVDRLSQTRDRILGPPSITNITDVSKRRWG